MNFICMRRENHFHITGFALSCLLNQRHGATRKWPVHLHWISKVTETVGSVTRTELIQCSFTKPQEGNRCFFYILCSVILINDKKQYLFISYYTELLAIYVIYHYPRLEPTTHDARPLIKLDLMRFCFAHFCQEDQEGARNKKRGLRAVSFPRRN